MPFCTICYEDDRDVYNYKACPCKTTNICETCLMDEHFTRQCPSCGKQFMKNNTMFKIYKYEVGLMDGTISILTLMDYFHNCTETRDDYMFFYTMLLSFLTRYLMLVRTREMNNDNRSFVLSIWSIHVHVLVYMMYICCVKSPLTNILTIHSLLSHLSLIPYLIAVNIGEEYKFSPFQRNYIDNRFTKIID